MRGRGGGLCSHHCWTGLGCTCPNRGSRQGVGAQGSRGAGRARPNCTHAMQRAPHCTHATQPKYAARAGCRLSMCCPEARASGCHPPSCAVHIRCLIWRSACAGAASRTPGCKPGQAPPTDGAAGSPAPQGAGPGGSHARCMSPCDQHGGVPHGAHVAGGRRAHRGPCFAPVVAEKHDKQLLLVARGPVRCSLRGPGASGS